MIIRHLAIQKFRNLSQVKLAPGEKVNFFIGDNAQGKTNLLEAIGFMSDGRSFRTSKEGEMIAWDSAFARIEAILEAGRRKCEILS